MKLHKATRLLKLPFRAPACWGSQAMWNQYRKDAQFTAADYFTYCTDCTAERQAEMKTQGRCAHPEVRFKKTGGLIPWSTGKRTVH